MPDSAAERPCPSTAPGFAVEDASEVEAPDLGILIGEVSVLLEHGLTKKDARALCNAARDLCKCKFVSDYHGRFASNISALACTTGESRLFIVSDSDKWAFFGYALGTLRHMSYDGTSWVSEMYLDHLSIASEAWALGLGRNLLAHLGQRYDSSRISLWCEKGLRGFHTPAGFGDSDPPCGHEPWGADYVYLVRPPLRRANRRGPRRGRARQEGVS